MASQAGLGDRLSDHRVRHLVVLVGSNPLPNFVAARLLLEPGGHLSLVHSESGVMVDGAERGTREVAERIKDVLRQPTGGRTAGQPFYQLSPDEVDERVHLVPFKDPSNSVDIARAVGKAMADGRERDPDGTVGLHYIGGTKPMSVYAVLKAFVDGNGVSFSHLDARKLEMVVDAADPFKDRLDPVYVGDLDVVNREDLLRLHGWKREPQYYTAGSVEHDALVRVARVYLAPFMRLMEADGQDGEGERVRFRHSHAWGYQMWHVKNGLSTWSGYWSGPDPNPVRERTRFRDGRPASTLYIPALGSASRSVPDWVRGAENRHLVAGAEADVSDALGEVQHALVEEVRALLPTDQEATDGQDRLWLVRAAQALGFHKRNREEDVWVGDLLRWLRGSWLESLALDALVRAEDDLGLHGVAWSVESRPDIQALRTDDGTDDYDKFELDVMALRGYQLFAVSCTTSQGKSDVKKKLFEVLHRARQIGGDEARAAVVSAVRNPAAVQNELYATYGLGPQVRVFGLHDLPHLGTKLPEWIRDASRIGT
ncbi:MAG: hypothetical protein AAGI91_15325 [Bacteroidota bacterium]